LNGMKRIAIIGAGSWGTALCRLAAARGHEVRLWVHDPALAELMLATRENPVYLPGFDLHPKARISTSFEEVLDGAELVLSVVPSHVCRAVFTEMRPFLDPLMIFVSATKGIENETHQRMQEVVRDVLRDHFEPRYVVLSGPSFALEVARGDPTAIVAASPHLDVARLVQEELSSPAFRIYTSTDVVSVELGGAVKNVMAIAAGVVAGLGWGYNSTVALATRGLAEMTRLAAALGGRPETLAGLAGMGDLVLTCVGELSRNRRVGFELGRGRKLSEVLAEMKMVAEGVRTTRAVYELSRQLGVDVPITASVYAMLYEEKNPRAAAEELMVRPLRREM
jgi:glycerol-3-phosphate dehydrogenase (NAD(P)+)